MRYLAIILSFAIVFSQDSEVLLLKGNSQLSLGHIEDAEIIFNSILKIDPTFAPALQALSKLNLHKGDLKKANEYSNQAVTADEDFRDWSVKIFAIREHILNGNRNIQQGLFEEAIKEYDKISQTHPYFPDAEYYKGLTRFRQKDIEAAGRHFSNALKIYPKHEKARKGLDNTRSQLLNLGNKSYRSGNLEQAINYCEKSIELDPNWYVPYYQMGVIYRKLDQYEKSIEYLNRVLEIKPDHDKTWFTLGTHYESIDNLHNAITHYNKALELNPNYYKASSNLAKCYADIGQYRQAEQIIYECISTFPDTTNPEAMITLYNRLASIYIYQDYYSKAKNSLYKAISYGPLDPSVWYQLARSHNELDEWHEAKKAAERCLELDENNSPGIAELAQAYQGLEDYDNALNQYQRLLDDDDWNQWAHENISYVHIAKGDSDYAVNEFIESVSDQNKDSEYYYRLGYLYYHAQKFDEAITEFIRAIELSENNEDKANHNFWVGFIYKEMGMIDNAIEYFENSLALNPETPGPLWHVYKAYKSIGKYESAFEIIQKLKIIDPENSHIDIEIDFIAEKIGKKEVDDHVIKQPRRLPPKIVIHDLKIIEPSGNLALDSEEKGYIEFSLKNEGRGSAYGLSIKANIIEGVFLEIDKKRIKNIKELSPGIEEIFKIPIFAKKNIIDQTCNLRIEALEEFGYDSDPVEISFQTLKKSLPIIELAALSIDDTEGENSSGNGNTIIEAGEYVVATAYLQNHSSFDVTELKAKFIKPEKQKYVYLTQLDSIFRLQNISSGDFSKINFDFSVTPRFEKQGNSEIPISMQLFYDNELLKTIDLGLKLKKRNNSVSSVNISKIDVNKNVMLKEIAELKPIDVDINIPDLKNINRHSIAVVVGIEDYRYAPKVEFAENDANIFYKYAKNILGVPKKRINLLKNEDATLGGLKSIFGKENWIDKRISNKDSTDIYIFFAGHGYGKTKNDITKGYLIPYDIKPEYANTGLLIDEIYDYLGNLDVRSSTVFLDACFSGQDRNYELVVSGIRPVLMEVNVSYKANVTVISASTSKQVSGSFPNKKHGLFTYFLLKGLRPENWKNNTSLSYNELFQFIESNVIHEAGNMDRIQNPTISTYDGTRLFIKR